MHLFEKKGKKTSFFPNDNPYLNRYVKSLDIFDSILPPNLQGIEVHKKDDINGTIIVRPYDFKAWIKNGVIYNYPNYIDIALRQAKCPGGNDTLVNKFIPCDQLQKVPLWRDACCPVFESVQKSFSSYKRIYFSLNVVEKELGKPSRKIEDVEYYSFILKKKILRVFNSNDKNDNNNNNNNKKNDLSESFFPE